MYFRTGRRAWAGAWLGAVLGLAAIASPARAEDPALRWKFEAGQTLGYEFTQENIIEIKLPEQAVETTSSLTFGLTWKVASVEADGAAKLDQTVDYVRVTVVAPGQGELVYDTREAGDPPGPLGMLKSLYGAVVGKPYHLTIDPRGRIRDVEVPAEVVTAAKTSPVGAMADGGSLLSAKGVERLFAQVIPPLPEGPAAPGATWDGKLELPAGPLEMTLDNRYTLDKADAGSAVIKSKIDTGIKPAAGSPIEVALDSQEGSGTYRFDPAAGRLVDTAVRQDIQMTLKAMGREIPQHFLINARIKTRDDVK